MYDVRVHRSVCIWMRLETDSWLRDDIIMTSSRIMFYCIIAEEVFVFFHICPITSTSWQFTAFILFECRSGGKYHRAQGILRLLIWVAYACSLQNQSLMVKKEI